jgi:hypothetical protein
MQKHPAVGQVSGRAMILAGSQYPPAARSVRAGATPEERSACSAQLAAASAAAEQLLHSWQGH